MTLEEAKDEMLKFVKLKTTMMPVFATVIMEQAEPVKHGRWIHERLASTGGGSYSVVRCSRCLWPEPEYPLMETNYCPNCGAKMDEVDHV